MPKWGTSVAYSLETKSRREAEVELEKLNIPKGKGWDNKPGANSRKLRGNVHREN